MTGPLEVGNKAREHFQEKDLFEEAHLPGKKEGAKVISLGKIPLSGTSVSPGGRHALPGTGKDSEKLSLKTPLRSSLWASERN